MSVDESVVQSLPASPVPSMASDVEGTASAAPGAEDSQVVQIQQARKRIKAEQDLMKKQAMNDQQVLKERLKAAKLENKLLMEQEKNLQAKQSRDKLAQKQQEKEEKQAQMEKEKQARSSAKADQVIGPAPGGSEIPPEVFTKARLTAPSFTEAGLTGMLFAIEIYAGCARLSGAMAEAGLNLFIPIDKEFGPWADTSNPAVASVILLAFDMGLIWYVHLATECKMWSKAARGTNSWCDSSVVWFTISVLQRVKQCHERGLKVWFSIENPYPSSLFDCSELLELLAALGARIVRYECCAWGAVWQKASHLRTNLPALDGLSKRCKDMPPHQHEVLEGTVTMSNDGVNNHVWKTSLAAKYTPDLCRAWARILKGVAPKNALAAPGANIMLPVWQHWLMQSCGLGPSPKFPEMPLPTCPTHFTTGQGLRVMSCERIHT